jgi:hypothetical protein
MQQHVRMEPPFAGAESTVALRGPLGIYARSRSYTVANLRWFPQWGKTRRIPQRRNGRPTSSSSPISQQINPVKPGERFLCCPGKRYPRALSAAPQDAADDVPFEREETDMAVYLVERDLPGVTMEELAAAQKRAILVGKELTAQGREVRYIRSMFVPGEGRCMCLFEAPNPEHVREANERAEIPFVRIVAAADLTPE